MKTLSGSFLQCFVKLFQDFVKRQQGSLERQQLSGATPRTP